MLGKALIQINGKDTKIFYVVSFFLKKTLYIKNNVYFCNLKSIGEQSSLDVHNLVMTSSERANLSISFFLCLYCCNTVLYFLA